MRFCGVEELFTEIEYCPPNSTVLSAMVSIHNARILEYLQKYWTKILFPPTGKYLNRPSIENSQ
jgi:hypothetical protein